MVVGVRKSLEEGRVYTYDALRDRFGLTGGDFERILDLLVERDCLKPMVFDCSARADRAAFVYASRENHLRWKAAHRSTDRHLPACRRMRLRHTEFIERLLRGYATRVEDGAPLSGVGRRASDDGESSPPAPSNGSSADARRLRRGKAMRTASPRRPSSLIN
ncbi:hypothetical protein [Raoultibacter phocaeensis]|uniref:hypothetical protein n=1 Tax=Raoultibacter phocaeensis TaxID=2479841 RepID=UPI00111A3468|nr:hypothetical protein [Raoultibacter phocaeensis]